LNLKTRKHFKLDLDTGEKVLMYIELIDENDKGISILFGDE